MSSKTLRSTRSTGALGKLWAPVPWMLEVPLLRFLVEGPGPLRARGPQRRRGRWGCVLPPPPVTPLRLRVAPGLPKTTALVKRVDDAELDQHKHIALVRATSELHKIAAGAVARVDVAIGPALSRRAAPKSETASATVW